MAALGEPQLHLGDASDGARRIRARGDRPRRLLRRRPAAGRLGERSRARRRLTLEPLRTVLAALRKHPEVTLTYVSSGGTVYGEPERLPVSESAPTVPSPPTERCTSPARTRSSGHAATTACGRGSSAARPSTASISYPTAARARSSPSCTGSSGASRSTSTAAARRSATTSTPATSPARVIALLDARPTLRRSSTSAAVRAPRCSSSCVWSRQQLGRSRPRSSAHPERRIRCPQDRARHEPADLLDFQPTPLDGSPTHAGSTGRGSIPSQRCALDGMSEPDPDPLPGSRGSTTAAATRTRSTGSAGSIASASRRR